jgi:hypothetical protein
MIRLGAPQIRASLPEAYRNYTLVCLYSSTKHGFSLTSMLNMLNKRERAKLMPDNTLLVVRDTDGFVRAGRRRAGCYLAIVAYRVLFVPGRYSADMPRRRGDDSRQRRTAATNASSTVWRPRLECIVRVLPATAAAATRTS